jgi:hypothetical protein
MDSVTTANWSAYVALLAWPVISFAIFRLKRPSEAAAWTILGAFLLLPSQVQIKIPMVPAIDKNSIACLSAFAGCIVCRTRPRRSNPRFGLVGVLATIYIFSPVITSALNNDTLLRGDTFLPGVGYYDGISAMLSQAISFIPFFIGRRFLQEDGDNEMILRVLLVGGVLLSFPMLFEIRMSPQLAEWIYGYFPSSFSVETRYGGFRPVVFMNNGLTAAFFLSTAFIAAIALWRAKTQFRQVPLGGLIPYLGLVILLSKSAGALVYSVIVGLLIRWLSPRAQIRIAISLVSLALLYPIMRIADYFPTDELVQLSTAFNGERADSLKFRFDQEELLLAHASERFIFGWGRYGRNRVYEESGKDVSITDGLWILTLGTFGIVGFIAEFGLLTLPVFRSRVIFKSTETAQDKIVISALALIVAITAIEQLPNASMSPWSWLLAGVLLGRTEQLRLVARRTTGTKSIKLSQPAQSAPQQPQLPLVVRPN